MKNKLLKIKITLTLSVLFCILHAAQSKLYHLDESSCVSEHFLGEAPVIDSLRIIPGLPLIGEDVRFAVYISEPFSGNCTYEMKIDSIVGRTIYMGGYIDSNNKCGDYQSIHIHDTINIGSFQETGVYHLIYNLSDIQRIFFPKTSSIDFEVDKSARMDKVDLNSVNFQNPAGDYLDITCSGKVEHIEILDLSGVRLHKKTFENVQDEYSLNIAFLKKGVYILSICSGKNEIKSYKLIKK